jgi:peroxiredoxin Q/BCP
VQEKATKMRNSDHEQMANLSPNESSSTPVNDSRQPEIGALAPDFALTSALGENIVRLSEYQDKDVLLIFFRGTWCPNCRRQFQVLRENYSRLQNVGIVVIGVICQSSGSVRRFLEASPLPFPLLIDGTRKVAKMYGVHYWFSWEGFNLANPALFILDRDRRVTFVYRGTNQRDLPLSSVLEKFVALLENQKPAE